MLPVAGTWSSQGGENVGHALVLAGPQKPGGSRAQGSSGWGRGKTEQFGIFLDSVHVITSAGDAVDAGLSLGCCVHRGEGAISLNPQLLCSSGQALSWPGGLKEEVCGGVPGRLHSPAHQGQPQWAPVQCTVLQCTHCTHTGRGALTMGGQPGADGPHRMLWDPKKLLLKSFPSRRLSATMLEQLVECVSWEICGTWCLWGHSSTSF